MSTFQVECSGMRGPVYIETVEAESAKLAKKKVNAMAIAAGLTPTRFEATELPDSSAPGETKAEVLDLAVPEDTLQAG